MGPSRVVAVVLGVALVAPFGLSARASAVGMSESYPREIAAIGTGEGVRLTRMQASIRQVAGRVRVTVRLAGASVAGTHRMEISAAPCTAPASTPKGFGLPGTPSSPICRPTAVRFVTVNETLFSLTRTLTIARPATRPGALRVRIIAVTSTKPAPVCTTVFCRRFPLTGDLLLNGNTWKYRPGTWWGIAQTPPAGLTFDRIAYNSRWVGWVATAASPATIITTQSYAGDPPAKTQATSLSAGIRASGPGGGAFGGEVQKRTTIRVLEDTAAIDGRRIFTMTLPLALWS